MPWLDYKTDTFQHPAKKLKKTVKSVHRMLGPRGNPRADDFLKIINILQANERVRLRLRVEAHKARHREHKHYRPLGFCL